MLLNLPTPAIIAHRGASAYAPENTLAAFSLALKQNADAIELDVKLTRDRHVIVIHDQTVDRTTEGRGDVRNLTLSEIRKLDAGSHFDCAFQGEPIPTLEEVLKAVGQLTYINIELTNYASPLDDLPGRVVRLVVQYKLAQRVFFSSFNPIALHKIKRDFPEAPAGLLILPGIKGFLSQSILGRIVAINSLHFEHKNISRNLIEKTHRDGKYILAYTVNDPNQVKTLSALGIDGIFTDDPVMARNVMNKKVKNVYPDKKTNGL